MFIFLGFQRIKYEKILNGKTQFKTKSCCFVKYVEMLKYLRSKIIQILVPYCGKWRREIWYLSPRICNCSPWGQIVSHKNVNIQKIKLELTLVLDELGIQWHSLRNVLNWIASQNVWNDCRLLYSFITTSCMLKHQLIATWLQPILMTTHVTVLGFIVLILREIIAYIMHAMNIFFNFVLCAFSCVLSCLTV